MAPEAEARQAEGQTAAQGLGHRLVRRLAVAAPVHRELLAARRRRAGEEDGLLLAAVLAQHLEDRAVVEVRVVVVHPLRVGAVGPGHVDRHAFAEVGLEAVDALREQRLQLGGVPVAGGRACEVDQGHAGLPHVPLPDAAVRALQQMPECPALGEQRGALGDVRVDPDTDAQVTGAQPGQHALRVREDPRIPLEVAPVELAHPEAVEVEDGEGELTLLHALDEGRHRLLVVRGGEGRRQPQAERPGGRQGRAAGQGRVLAQDVLRRGAVDDVVRQLLGLRAELHPGHDLRGDLEGHLARVVDEDAVARVCEVEGNVLVGLFAAGAAVGLPDVDDLPVLDQRAEALTEAVDGGADLEHQLFAQMVRAGRVPHDAHALGAAAGECAAVRGELDVPGAAAGHPDRQLSRGQGRVLVVVRDPRGRPGVGELELRAAGPLAREVRERQADDVGHGGVGAECQDGARQQVAAGADGPGRRVDLQRVVRLGDVEDLGRMGRGDALAQKPVAVGELHVGPLTSRRMMSKRFDKPNVCGVREGVNGW